MPPRFPKETLIPEPLSRRARPPAETMVLQYAASRPEFGQFRVAELVRSRGVRISPSGVRIIWKRHQLETAFKRLSALAKGSASRLNERQQARLQRARKSHELLGADNTGRPAGSRRRHLLTVAATIFARAGYQDTTLQDIAEAAGILPGSMYHYFRSKDELFAEVHREGFRWLNAAVDRATAGVSNPWRRLEAACAVHIEGLVSGNAITAFTGGTMFSHDRPHLHRRLIRERDAYEARIREMVAALPLPADIDRTVLRLSLLGSLNWTQVWFKPGKKAPAEIARQIVGSIRRSDVVTGRA